MVDAPEKLWMTAEELGWPGSFRSFRMSDLEHPEDEYPAYVRADLYEQVKRERDGANQRAEIMTGAAKRFEARAERLAGARVKMPSGELCRYIEQCREISNGGEYPWWSRLAEILSALAEPAGEAEPLSAQIERLASFIMEHVPGEPSQSEGAVDCAIRIIRNSLTTPPASAIREAAKRVIWFDWSENDPDAVAAIDGLRAALAGSAE